MASGQRPEHLKKLFDSLDEEDPYMDFIRKQIEEDKLKKKGEGLDQLPSIPKKSKNVSNVKKSASKTTDDNSDAKTRKKMKEGDGMEADESSPDQSKISSKKKQEPKTAKKSTWKPSGAVGKKMQTDDKLDAVDPSVENRLKEIFGNSLDEPDAYCVGVRAKIDAEKKEAAKKRKRRTSKANDKKRKTQSSSRPQKVSTKGREEGNFRIIKEEVRTKEEDE